MLLRSTIGPLLLTIALCHAGPPTATATPLYMLDVNGANNGNFRLVDPVNGGSTPINADSSLGPGSWNGLARLPGNSDFAYAVNNPHPGTFANPQTSRMARINIADGTATLFPLFDQNTLGVPEIFSTGIAISPLNPFIAIATGREVRGGDKRLIWKVHLATGTVLGPAVELQDGIRLHALDFSLDGTTLYAINNDAQLVTVVPETGAVTILGDTGIPMTRALEGLAFRPEDGTLFAIEAGTFDQLITLDPVNGSVLSTIGHIGTIGPEGLAFIPCGDVMPGDTNYDCVVDVEDLNNVRNNFGATGTPVLGDANGDGFVNIVDLNDVRNNFGATTAVPEPATALLVALGTILLPARRPRKGGRPNA